MHLTRERVADSLTPMSLSLYYSRRLISWVTTPCNSSPELESLVQIQVTEGSLQTSGSIVPNLKPACINPLMPKEFRKLLHGRWRQKVEGRMSIDRLAEGEGEVETTSPRHPAPPPPVLIRI